MYLSREIYIIYGAEMKILPGCNELNRCVVQISNISRPYRRRSLWSPSPTVFASSGTFFGSTLPSLNRYCESWVSNTASRQSLLGSTGNILPREPPLNHEVDAKSRARDKAQHYDYDSTNRTDDRADDRKTSSKGAKS